MALSLRENVCNAHRIPADQSVLSGRAALLAPRDRELIEAVLIRGVSATAIARLAGLSPRQVATRVKRTAARLASREFLDAARAMPYLPPEDAELARLRFCAGIGLRRLAEQLQLTQHEVRRRLDRLGAQIAMVRRINSRAGDTIDPEKFWPENLLRPIRRSARQAI